MTDYAKRFLAALTQPAPWSVSTDDHDRCVVLDANEMWVADLGPAPVEAAFIAAAPALIAELAAEIDRLRALLNTPLTDDFFAAVRNEAAHQIERWGSEHDAGKRPEDWIALLVYLVGKATKAHYDDDGEKLKHHVVTVAAVCLNWLRNVNGETTAMRPGVGKR